MKFRAARKSELKRQRVFEGSLAVAKRIASTEGMEGLTARRIARGAGCSVGTVYNVFGNLDTVILHLNATTLDALYGELATVDKAGDPAMKIGELVERYMKFTEDNANLWNVIFEHVWPKGYDLPDWYRRCIDRLLGVLADALAPLFPEDQKGERFHAATVLWGGLHGIHSLAATGKLGTITSENAHVMADMLTRNFIEGLRRR